MKKIFMVHGLKRSGNHAIINWLLPQAPTEYFNNIIPVASILTGHSTLPKEQTFEAWLKKKVRNQIKRAYLKAFKNFMVSLEDHTLDTYIFSPTPQEIVNILIIRDPENLFSSRVKKAFSINHPAYPRENSRILCRAISIWKQHAKEFLGDTNTLTNKVCISYNLWFSSSDYRRSISEQLGFEFSDKGLSLVTDTGGGSSFDATKFNQNSAQMNVLSRKAQLSDEEMALLNQIMSDPEIQELSARLDRNQHQSLSGYTQ